MRSLFPMLWTLLAGSLLSVPAAAKSVHGDMSPRQIKQYRIADALYLPFFGDERFEYPSDVLFGFYPEKVSQAALDCAEEAFAELTKFLDRELYPLAEVVKRGGTEKFVLWVNDYSQAADMRQRRTSSFWLYDKRNRRDPRFGVWHWEATLSQAGTCTTPSWAKAIRRLEQALEKLKP